MSMSRMKTIGHIQPHANGDYYNPAETMAALTEWEMQHHTYNYKMGPNFTWYSEVYDSDCQLWQWGRSIEVKHQYVSWWKTKKI